MSVTTTANAQTYAGLRILQDYDLHHSEELAHSNVPVEPNPHPAPEGTGEPVEGWETEWRRIPPHRPINHDLDFEFRNTFTNNAERFFLFNMFGGIQLTSVRWQTDIVRTKLIFSTGFEQDVEINRWQGKRQVLQVADWWRVVMGK